jgi:hypothetical protein
LGIKEDVGRAERVGLADEVINLLKMNVNLRLGSVEAEAKAEGVTTVDVLAGESDRGEVMEIGEGVVEGGEDVC